MLDRSRPTLCFVHSARTAGIPAPLAALDAEALAGLDLVQVRGKDLPDADLAALARAWIDRVAGAGPGVVVNDRVDVALACGARGAHLGADDEPLEAARARVPAGFLLGASAHSREELLRAQAEGADYAGLGAFHPTATKGAADPLGSRREALEEPVDALLIPVLAIGGMTAERVAGALRLPAVTGVAVSSAIQDAPDPGAAVRALRAALDRAWEARR